VTGDIVSEAGVVIDTLGIFSVMGAHDPPEYGDIGADKDEFVVIIPMGDILGEYSDDEPRVETQEARLSLFTRHDYTGIKTRLTKVLLNAGFDITDRRYIGWERSKHYHHYAIDVAKTYGFDQHDGQKGEI
jgi:hypothetical protein